MSNNEITIASPFDINEVPQSLTGSIYDRKNIDRIQLLFELERNVYKILSDISALRSSANPIPISTAAEALRQKMIPLLLFLEPLMIKKKNTIGIDFWDGEEIHLGALDIPDVVSYCNTDIRELYGLGRVVDLPERIKYALPTSSKSLGYSGKRELEYQNTCIPFAVMLKSFRETRRFMEIVQLNLFIDDKLPITMKVPGVNEEDFI